MTRHAEAIELAARLQEEERHDEALLRAAEEAGIEPRHVREALARLEKAAVPTVPLAPVALTLVGLVACCFWLAYGSWDAPSALLAASALGGLAFSVFSPRWRVAAALAAFGWASALAVMMFYNKTHYGQFFMAPAYEILRHVLKCVLATAVGAWVAYRARKA